MTGPADEPPPLLRRSAIGSAKAESVALQKPPILGARAFQGSVALLALLFLALHFPYLPASLEDLDSINFALGLRQFDVARHQPHPPGYPLFILAGKAVQAIVRAEATALALVSVIAGALGVLAMARLFRRLDPADDSLAWPLATTGMAMTAPLYWFTSARPLSDVSGLAAALAVQAMTLGAGNARSLVLAGFAAGVAVGLRSQVAWLTVPLLLLVNARGAASRAAYAAAAFIAFVAGVLIWFVPLVIVSGGPLAYWHALSNQGAEDLGNIQMLWRTHHARDVADALYYAFVAPWASWPIAVVVLLCAALGIARLYRRARPALLLLAVAFGPYLAFDLLFQETFTSRYALPLVIPMAYLGVAGMRIVPRDIGLALALAIALRDAHIGGTSIAAYARAKAPAFRLLDDMRASAPSLREPPALAMDRRESLDFRRPIAWVGEGMPATVRTLPAPPQHEWLEAVKYWNGGGRAPLWFVVDPMRTSIDLVQHGSPSEYRWPLPYPVLMSGTRPNEMDWYRIDRPEWYVGEGWSLTPEAAGVAEMDQRGLAHAAIEGWVRRDVLLGGAVVVGGRNFEPTLRPRVTVAIDGAWSRELTVASGVFLDVVNLPHLDIDSTLPEYMRLTVSASPPSRLAVEQFDATSGVEPRPVFGFADGWHEQEFNPRTGLRWRWLSERGELRLPARPAMTPGALPPGTTRRLTLRLEGESPRRYFSRGSRLLVRSGPAVVFDRVLTDDFAVDVPLGYPAETLVLETDQVFAPADRSRRSADRRHLGLRIFKCAVAPVF